LDIKQKIRKRRDAFKLGDQAEYKRARYELQNPIRAAKRAYSQKLEGYNLNHNTHIYGRESSMSQTIGEPQQPQTPMMPPF